MISWIITSADVLRYNFYIIYYRLFLILCGVGNDMQQLERNGFGENYTVFGLLNINTVCFQCVDGGNQKNRIT